MSRRLAHPPGKQNALRWSIVVMAAVVLAVSALGFLVWALVTRSTDELAWLTSIATVLAVVLSSWGMSATMLAWAVRHRRAMAESGLRQTNRNTGQVVVGEIPREPAGFQPRGGLQAQLTAVKGVAVLSAVTGGRGVGKTQLAAAIARRRITEGWPVVAWIVAEDPDQVLSGMDRLARGLGLVSTEDDSVTAARAARTWLETLAPARCLVVFDNVSDPTVVRPWLPAAGRARVILTSTSRACEDLGTLVRVEPFTSTEAVAFLAALTGLDDQVGASELAEEVGHLPLALGQAAAAVRGQRLSYSAMLERIRAFPVSQHLRRQPSGVYPRGAAEAVLLAVRQAEEAVRQAEESEPLVGTLTGLIAVLSPAGIRRDVLHAFAERAEQLGIRCERHGSVSTACIDASLGHLAEASLLTFTLNGEAILMHRFTQRVLRDQADNTGLLPELIVEAARLVRARRPDPRSAVPAGELWVTQRALGQHLITQIDALWEVTGQHIVMAADGNAFDEPRDIVLALRSWSISYLWNTNDPGWAIEIGNVVVADHERILGDDSCATMKASYGLALAYGMQRRHDEAIRLNERIVDWSTVDRGPRDPDTINFRNTLANNYLESAEDFAEPGRLDVAIALHEQNLAEWQQVGSAGLDHNPNRFYTYACLANAYAKSGRSKEAIELAEPAVRTCTQELGDTHLLTFSVSFACAAAYASAGRLDDAVIVSRQVAERAHRWGEGSPLTLYYRQKHAEYLSQAGELSAGISELEQTAVALEELLGENNQVTCRCLEALSEAYSRADRFPDAIQVHQKTLKICLDTVGNDSPLTHRIREQIAELRARNTRPEETKIIRVLRGRLHRARDFET